MEGMSDGGSFTNALYIAQGEISCIVTEMKRSLRYSNHTIVSTGGKKTPFPTCTIPLGTPTNTFLWWSHRLCSNNMVWLSFVFQASEQNIYPAKQKFSKANI